MNIEDIEDLLPIQAIKEICTSGDNELACIKWHDKLNLILSRKDCLKIIVPYGAWTDEELATKDTIELNRIVIWLAAWNCYEFRESLY